MNLKTVHVREGLGQSVPVTQMLLNVVSEVWLDRLIEPLDLLIRLGEVGSRQIKRSSLAWHIRCQKAYRKPNAYSEWPKNALASVAAMMVYRSTKRTNLESRTDTQLIASTEQDTKPWLPTVLIQRFVAFCRAPTGVSQARSGLFHTSTRVVQPFTLLPCRAGL